MNITKKAKEHQAVGKNFSDSYDYFHEDSVFCLPNDEVQLLSEELSTVPAYESVVNAFLDMTGIKLGDLSSRLSYKILDRILEDQEKII